MADADEAIQQESPADRDRRKARERMREKRAKGTTIADKARTEATSELIRRHRDEFDRLLAERKLALMAEAG